MQAAEQALGISILLLVPHSRYGLRNLRRRVVAKFNKRSVHGRCTSKHSSKGLMAVCIVHCRRPHAGSGRFSSGTLRVPTGSEVQILSARPILSVRYKQFLACRPQRCRRFCSCEILKDQQVRFQVRDIVKASRLASAAFFTPGHPWFNWPISPSNHCGE